MFYLSDKNKQTKNPTNSMTITTMAQIAAVFTDALIL